MKGRGNCCDNAAALRRENGPLDGFLILPTFFMTIKAERIWRRTPASPPSGGDGVRAIVWTNGRHALTPRHQRLSYPAPSPFRMARHRSDGLQTQVGPNARQGWHKIPTGPSQDKRDVALGLDQGSDFWSTGWPRRRSGRRRQLGVEVATRHIHCSVPGGAFAKPRRPSGRGSYFSTG